MKVDILVLAAHPDDAELACSGTIASHIAQGKKVAIIDLTEGELGTRGTVEMRYQEAEKSSQILGLSARDNLQLPDGFLENTRTHQMKVIEAIRKYQPEILLANAIFDRHPDHIKGAKIAYDAYFLSGLRKIETFDENGKAHKAWRPKSLYHYIQDQYIQPDFIVDISDFWETKLACIKAFASQFYNPDSDEPATYIASPDFLEAIEARAKEMGHAIGVKYGEGFTKNKHLGIKSLFQLSTSQ